MFQSPAQSYFYQKDIIVANLMFIPSSSNCKDYGNGNGHSKIWDVPEEHPLVNWQFAIENGPFKTWYNLIYLFKMVMFCSYVSLPECNPWWG